MTHYFDAEDRRIAECMTSFMQNGKLLDEDRKRLRAVEHHMVSSVTLCIMTRGFPLGLRRAAHLIILDHAVEERPSNRANHPQAHLFSNAGDHIRAIGKLSYELHSLFHEVARRNLRGFTDDPTFTLRQVFMRGERERSRIRWPTEKKTTFSDRG